MLRALGRTLRLTHHGRKSVTIYLICVGLALIGATPAIAHLRRVHRRPAAAISATNPSASVGVQTIIAVGDSITKGDWDTQVPGGWVTRLGDKLRVAYPRTRFVVRNAGIDGDTTAGVIARLSRDVTKRSPRLVLVAIGTNDFDVGVNPSSFALELRILVEKLRSAADAPVVVLSSMLPIAGQLPVRLVEQRRYNDIIRRTASKTGVGYLDLFDPWLAMGSSYLHSLRHDDEHPNPIGYELLASTTAAFLEAEYFDTNGRIVPPASPPTCDVLVCDSA